MSNSITACYTFLQSTLTGDTTFMSYVTGVFADLAEPKTLPDFCVVSSQSPMDILTANANRIMDSNLFLVKLVGPATDYSNLSTAYDRADTLLGLVRTTGGILCCYREKPFYLSEIVNGETWVNLGGLYRIEL